MKAILSGFAGAMLFAATANAAILTNGSFETGNFDGWTVTDSGGTTPGNGPLVITTGGTNSTGYTDNVPNYDGTHAAFFVDDNATQSISQTVTLAANTKYRLDFALFATQSGALNDNFFTLSDSLGSTTINSFTNQGNLTQVPVGQWTAEYGFFTTGAAQPYTLTFNFTSGGTAAKDVLLDAVSLSAVPLPASLPMFGGALLALVGFSYAMNRRVDPKGKHAAAA